MPDTRIKVAVGGGHELDRAGRAALISRLPGLRVVDIDAQPQVLVWQIKEIDELPSTGASTALLLIIDQLELEGLPGTVTGLFSTVCLKRCHQDEMIRRASLPSTSARSSTTRPKPPA